MARRKKKLSLKDKRREKIISQALEDHSRRDKKRRNIRIVLLLILLVVSIIAVRTCIPKKAEVVEDIDREPPAIRLDETSTIGNIGVEAETRDGEDIGKYCREHEYILAPGGSSSLNFEVLLARQGLELSYLGDKKLDRDDITLELERDDWKEGVIVADIASVELEPLPAGSYVWAVQAEALQAALRIAVEDAGPGSDLSADAIEGFIDKKYHFTVRFIDDTYGVISQLGRNYDNAAKVGRLRESDIVARLGGKPRITHDFKGLTYELPLERLPVGKDYYILNIALSVDLPQEYDKNETGSIRRYIVKINETPDVKFDIKFTFDKDKDGEFHFIGPAQDADCIRNRLKITEPK